MMKRAIYVMTAVLCLVFAAVSTPASSVSINLSTGQSPLGTLSTTVGACDAQWTAVNETPSNGTPYGCSGSPNPAQMVFSTDNDWYGGWVADGTSTANGCTSLSTSTSCSTTGSNWVAVNSGYTANGLGDYSVTFNLTGDNLSTITIAGGWTLDDSGSLWLNSCEIGSLGNGNWTSLNAFSITTTSNPGCINQGSNTLTVDITSTDDYLEGVNVDATVTGETGVTPEPASFLLFGTGVLALAGAIRRKVWA